MAGEIIIKVRGDASQLKSFYASVNQDAHQFVGQMQSTYQKMFSQMLGTEAKLFQTGTYTKGAMAGLPIIKRFGTEIRNISVEADALNNVLKVTGESVIRLGDKVISSGKTTVFRGSVTALDEMNRKMRESIAHGKELEARGQRFAQAVQASVAPYKAQQAAALGLLNAEKAIKAGRIADRKVIKQDVTTRQAEIAQRQADRAPGGRLASLGGWGGAAFDAKTAGLQTALIGRQGDLALANTKVGQAVYSTSQAQKAYNGVLAATNPMIQAATNRIAAFETKIKSLRNALATKVGGLLTDRRNLLTNENVAAPVGYGYLPPKVQKLLTGKRVGMAATGKELYAQNAQFNAPFRDLERGLTTFSGQFEKTAKIAGRSVPIMQQWSTTVDDMGNVVQSTSRNLRGFGNMLSMIGRDFQKVIEWTVATTLIFGGIQAMGQGLGIIKQLDADLTRFSVTAGLSAEATKSFYNELFKVAQATATPIEELVTAADDLALAIKKPGQSAQELTKDIATLAEAIGIYTNLTGQDTVSATDQLVAVMKQLGYEANEVNIILNKVTASAGGQSGAIADITKGLAVMAEAGKQAGLSVDQQIGVIKTLSQVTSKSPAEVATAFKNLVGALSNPAAIKALSGLGIPLISQGNNIINIYREIARQRDAGLIPATEVSGLLRAISGGPRRSPDAAALLANINTVLLETAISAAATNEAFLANAQIMDTLNAKFTQFQNLLKGKVFTTFGELFKDVALTGVEFATTLVNALDVVNGSMLKAAASVAALFLGVKLGTRLLFALGAAAKGAIGVLWSGLTGATVSAKNLAAALSLVGQEIRKNGMLAGVKGAGQLLPSGFTGALKAGGAGALIGGAAAAASGGGMQQILGTGLSGLGMGLMLMPDPSMVTKVVGGLAILAGTVLSLSENTEKAAEDTGELKLQLVNLFKASEAASQSLYGAGEAPGLMDTKKSIEDQIAVLKKGGVEGAEEQGKLLALQEDYGKNAVLISKANKELAESFKGLNDVLGQLGESFETRMDLANFMSHEELKALVRQYTQEILDIVNPDMVFNGKILAPDLFGQGEGTAGRTREIPLTNERPEDSQFSLTEPRRLLGRGGRGAPRLPQGTNAIKMDLQNLSDSDLSKLIKQMKELGTIPFKATGENFDYILTKINLMEASAEKEGLLQYVNKIKSSMSNDTTIKQWFDDFGKTIEAFGPLAGKSFTDIGKQAKAAFETIVAGKQAGLPGMDQFADDIMKQLADAFNNEIPLGDKVMQGIAAKFAEATNGVNFTNASLEEQQSQINGILTLWTLVDAIIDIVNGSLEEMSDATIEIIKSLGKARDSMLGEIATESATNYNDYLSGEISLDKYVKLQGVLKQTRIAIKQTTAALMDAAEQTSAEIFTEAIHDWAKGLQEIPGLEDAASLGADELITRLFSLAGQFGLTGKQLKDFKGEILDVAAALKLVVDTPYVIYIGADISQLKATLKAMKKALAGVAKSNYTGGPTGLSIAAGQLKELETMIGALDTINNFDPSKYYSGGSGTSGGGGSKAKATKDYSELDLPEELSGLSNRDALIAAAIKNAKELQKKIPGASKEAKNDVVTILDGMQKLETVRGVREDLLRRALEDLAEIEKKRLEAELKVSQISRIRVGSGSFAALANVPTSAMGISTAGPDGPVNVNLNVNGQILTPAQMTHLAELIAAHIKSGISKA